MVSDQVLVGRQCLCPTSPLRGQVSATPSSLHASPAFLEAMPLRPEPAWTSMLKRLIWGGAIRIARDLFPQLLTG